MAAVLSLVGLVDAVCLLDQEMTANQLRMFLLIASKNGGTSQVELAQQMQLTSGGLSKIASKLSKWRAFQVSGLDLIEVNIDPKDRRFKRMELTAKGRRFLDSLLKAIP